MLVRLTFCFLAIATVGQNVHVDAAMDYCSPELCAFPWIDNASKHVACDPKEGFGGNCGTNPKMNVLTPEVKQAVVEKFNEFRNNLAKGQVISFSQEKFPPAARLAFMDWDDELENLATVSAKLCSSGDDLCHNTNVYKATNVVKHAVGYPESPNANATATLLASIAGLYQSHEETWVNQMNKYPHKSLTSGIKNFAAIMNDHNTAFGCAQSITDSTPGWTNFYLTCVFSTMNVGSKPVYKFSEEAGSECNSRHPVYTSLCDKGEPIDPNNGYELRKADWEKEQAKWYTPETLKEHLEVISKRDDYCDPNLCQPLVSFTDLQKSVCNFTKEFGSTCTNPKMMRMNRDEQEMILEKLNHFRNITAGGGTIGVDDVALPKATKMPYLEWDEELADRALVVLKECPEKIPESCGNTFKYKATSSSSYRHKATENFRPKRFISDTLLEIWFRGSKETNLEKIQKYPSVMDAQKIRDFALIVADHTTKVGCSYLVNDDTEKTYSFLCFYSTQNFKDHPIYTIGNDTASGCTTKHPKFINLCDVSETVNPNQVYDILKERFDKARYASDDIPVFLKSIVKADNYCSKKLCKSGSEYHVACNAKTKLGPKCSKNAQLVKFTPEMKKVLVDEHNRYRNLTAAGETIGDNGVKLPKAVRMAYMQWDDELANMAAMHAKDCTYAHDKCHNTKSFLYSGQNLFLSITNGLVETDQLLISAPESWFLESKDTSTDQIKKYPTEETPKDRVIGHFTVMVNDKSTRMGCAIALYAEDNTNQAFVVCNYATTNWLAHRVYKTGDVEAKECEKTHPEYTSLCAEDEPIDPNKVLDLSGKGRPRIDKIIPKNILPSTKNDTTVMSILKPIVDRQHYCDPSLCHSKRDHVGCNKTAELGPKCGLHRQIVAMTPQRVAAILERHNFLRNQTASGQTSGADENMLPKASKMAYMQWDQELADLALLNIKECEFRHDPCRNTKDFKASGQNIYTAFETHSDHNYTKKLREGVEAWFSEHKFTLPKEIASYTGQSSPPNNQIGHFTAMVNGLSTRVGCGAIAYREKIDGMSGTSFLYTCNYARTNMLSSPVYTSSNETGSSCKSMHKDFSGLCHESEEIDPNEGISSGDDFKGFDVGNLINMSQMIPMSSGDLSKLFGQPHPGNFGIFTIPSPKGNETNLGKDSLGGVDTNGSTTPPHSIFTQMFPGMFPTGEFGEQSPNKTVVIESGFMVPSQIEPAVNKTSLEEPLVESRFGDDIDSNKIDGDAEVATTTPRAISTFEQMFPSSFSLDGFRQNGTFVIESGFMKPKNGQDVLVNDTDASNDKETTTTSHPPSSMPNMFPGFFSPGGFSLPPQFGPSAPHTQTVVIQHGFMTPEINQTFIMSSPTDGTPSQHDQHKDIISRFFEGSTQPFPPPMPPHTEVIQRSSFGPFGEQRQVVFNNVVVGDNSQTDTMPDFTKMFGQPFNPMTGQNQVFEQRFQSPGRVVERVQIQSGPVRMSGGFQSPGGERVQIQSGPILMSGRPEETNPTSFNHRRPQFDLGNMFGRDSNMRRTFGSFRKVKRIPGFVPSSQPIPIAGN